VSDVTLLFYRGPLNTHLSFFGSLFLSINIALVASVANSANFNVAVGNNLSYIENATQTRSLALSLASTFKFSQLNTFGWAWTM